MLLKQLDRGLIELSYILLLILDNTSSKSANQSFMIGSSVLNISPIPQVVHGAKADTGCIQRVS